MFPFGLVVTLRLFLESSGFECGVKNLLFKLGVDGYLHL